MTLPFSMTAVDSIRPAGTLKETRSFLISPASMTSLVRAMMAWPHCAVALVVQKKDIEVCIVRGREDGAVHVGMAARFKHEAGAQMVIVLAEVAAFLEHGLAFDRR